MMPRSALYVPAHSVKLLDWALSARPDAVIVDLEDGVPDGDKDDARAMCGAAVERVVGAGLAAVVRVNGVDTDRFDADVAVALATGAGTVLLPKGGVDEVGELHRRSGGGLAVWSLVERMRDVSAVADLLATGSVAAVTLGYGDLCKEIGLTLGTGHPHLVEARRLVAVASSEAGVPALDGVVVGPPEAVEDECRRSRADGFVGRTLYDSRHVAGCHAAFVS
jgi:citrate lyase beta subunit